MFALSEKSAEKKTKTGRLPIAHYKQKPAGSDLWPVNRCIPIVDDPESVLNDKGPLVRIWSDGLVAEYRKALPFLDLTWSNRTLRSNLDRLATWERDADIKAKVRVAAATFNTTKQDNRWSKRESKCKYCAKLGHWEKECRKKLQDSKRNAMHNSAPSQPAHNPEVVPPVTTETLGQLVQALLRAQQDQEKN